ncbi:hypothetical protein GCM10020331_012010 [Ectobacillus funiculus]
MLKKGILFKGESGIEGNNAKSLCNFFCKPTYFFMQEIKKNVNEALKVMFHKAMKNADLKKNYQINCFKNIN